MKKKTDKINAVEMMREIKADMSEEFTTNSELFFKEIERLTNDFTMRQKSRAANKPAKKSGRKSGKKVP